MQSVEIDAFMEIFRLLSINLDASNLMDSMFPYPYIGNWVSSCVAMDI